MVPLLVPEVFPPVDFSMQAHVFFGDTWHHPYISTCFCGKPFYFPFLFRTTNDWHRALDAGLAIGVLILDVSKAFNPVDHSVLTSNLASYGVSPPTVK